MWQIRVLLFRTFWNFFPDIFDPWLVESVDGEFRGLTVYTVHHIHIM